MKLVTIGLALFLSAGLAQAQQSCQVIGNQMYCSGGNYAGSQTIGNTRYCN